MLHAIGLNRLGKGSGGEVWRAHDSALDRTVALKLAREEEDLAKSRLEQFQWEVTIGSRLRHPNIVQVYECGIENSRIFVASEFVDGSTLSAWLYFHKPTTTKAARMVAIIAEAIDYAHQCGVVHCDLKPKNILLDSNEGPHVADFGIALVEGTDDEDRRPVLRGTPAYMAPEHISQGKVDHRVDIYGIGLVLYEILTQKRPFDSDGRTFHNTIHQMPAAPGTVDDAVPERLDEI